MHPANFKNALNGGSAPPFAVSDAVACDQAVYLDSPVISALRQILPFYDSGMFGRTETPLFMRINAWHWAQLATNNLPRDLDIRNIRNKQIRRIPLSPGGVVFYPFNSQSNLNLVTNRGVHHVLTLHGESNKLASNRPAARLYDYISVAGGLSRDRYLAAGIFTPADVDGGRLVMMGDSFVQALDWIAPAARDADNAALLYCPTWEGYDNGRDNYSSITARYGFYTAARAARAAGITRVVVKPHPYLGLLQPRLLRDFVSGVRQLSADGFQPELSLDDASLPIRIVSRMRLGGIPRLNASSITPLPVALGLCDVSGMEAVFLKQHISHMVITHPENIPVPLQDFYYKKAFLPETCVENATIAYLEDAQVIDAIHRARVFCWHAPELEKQNGAARRAWLINYVHQDPFWNGAGKGT